MIRARGHITHYSSYRLLFTHLLMDYYYYSLLLFVVCIGWPAAPGGWNSPVHIHLTSFPSSPIILVLAGWATEFEPLHGPSSRCLTDWIKLITWSLLMQASIKGPCFPIKKPPNKLITMCCKNTLWAVKFIFLHTKGVASSSHLFWPIFIKQSNTNKPVRYFGGRKLQFNVMFC